MSSYGTIENKSNRSATQLLVWEDDRFRLDTPFQDKLFAILFLIWFILIMILSIFFFVQNKSTFQSDSANSNNEYLNQHFWKLLILSIAISVGNTILLLCILHKYSYHFIWFTFISSFLLWLIYGITLIIAFGSIITGIFALFIALIQFLWIYIIRYRIQFTTALIKLSIDGLNTFPSTYLVSVFGIILQISFLIIWCMGFSYSIDGTQSTQMVIFLYIIAYYWTFQVITNIVLCSTCGSVAMWYFLYPEHTPSYHVYHSFKRSVSTSFGSICYGSVIIAIVQTLRICINIGRAVIRDRRHNVCIGCITVCIVGLLRCVGDIIEYINSYVFVRISMYGLDYCSSAKQTMSLFKSRGFDMVINDDLTNAVLILSCLMCSTLNGLIIGAISKYTYNNNSIETVVLWSFTAIAISFALCMCCMVIVKAGVFTIVVCFAEDPAVLSFTKPKKYDFLTNAWNMRYGSLPKKLTNPPRTP